MTFTANTTGVEVVSKFSLQVAGKIFVITGPTPGSIGAQMALDLAAAEPARIILVGRSLVKTQPVLDAIAAIDGSVATNFVTVDLASLASVAAAAAEIAELTRESGIDVLINNAGIMAVATYKKSQEDIELQFAVNFLSHFALTAALFEKVAVRKVVNVTSTAAYIEGFRGVEEYNFSEETYNPWLAYCQSKTCNILFSNILAARGVKAFSAHPGRVPATGLQNDVSEELFMAGLKLGEERNNGTFQPPVPKSLAAGTSTPLVAALDPKLEEDNGAFLIDANVVPKSRMKEHMNDPQAAETLWTLSEGLIGKKFVV